MWERDSDEKSKNILDESLKRFKYDEIKIEKPILLNSVPKSGTNLLRNIIMHFVGRERTCPVAVVPETLEEVKGLKNYDFYYGHLFKNPSAYLYSRNFNMVLLMRDPLKYIPSMARWAFHHSKPWGDISEVIQAEQVPFHEVMNYCITGIQQNFGIPSLKDMYLKNLIEWIDSAAILVRYEELTKHIKQIDSIQTEKYFGSLFNSMGIVLPTDWKERVLAGSNPEGSPTYYSGARSELTEYQHLLANAEAPSLRKILGYQQ